MIKDILDNLDLKTELTVLNEMVFIDLLSELGYREDKYWTPEEDPILQKLCDCAEKHTNEILKVVEKYKNE